MPESKRRDREVVKTRYSKKDPVIGGKTIKRTDRNKSPDERKLGRVRTTTTVPDTRYRSTDDIFNDVVAKWKSRAWKTVGGAGILSGLYGGLSSEPMQELYADTAKRFPRLANIFSDSVSAEENDGSGLQFQQSTQEELDAFMEELRKEQAATKNNELEDKDEMSLQTLQNEIVDEDRGRAGITSDPLDMARMGFAIAGARSIPELSQGLYGLATDIQGRRVEDKKLEMEGDIAIATIQQLKAQANLYEQQGKYAAAGELNNLARQYSTMLTPLMQQVMMGNEEAKIQMQDIIDSMNDVLSRSKRELGIEVNPDDKQARQDRSAINQATVSP